MYFNTKIIITLDESTNASHSFKTLSDLFFKADGLVKNAVCVCFQRLNVLISALNKDCDFFCAHFFWHGEIREKEELGRKMSASFLNALNKLHLRGETKQYRYNISSHILGRKDFETLVLTFQFFCRS